jgi:ABC-type nitrate/sulfonate/bicarbonate transport system substrate-binding protein
MVVRFPVTRRSLLLAGSAVLATGLPVIKSRAADKVEFRTGFLNQVDAPWGAHWTATDKKFFDEEGIANKVVLGGPNAPPMLTLLSAGQAEVGIGNWFNVTDASAKGNDLVIIAANYPQNPVGLMSLPKAPIRTAADIVDKTVLLQFKYYTETIDAILRYNNLPVRYNTKPTGFSADTLLAGDGQGYFSYVDRSPLLLELRGMKRDQDFIVTTFSSMGYDLPDGLYVVKRETLEKNRPAVVGYLRALLRGIAVDDKDPDYMVDIIVNKYVVDRNLDPKFERAQADVYKVLSRVPGGKGPLWFSPQQIDRMYQFATITGRTNLPDRTKVIDLGPLEEALRTV